MNKNLKLKLLSLSLATLVIFNFIPVNVVKALGDFGFTSTVISKPINNYDVTLAPGVKEKKYSFEDSTGKRVETFVLEVDTKNPKVSMEAGTPNDGNEIGLQTVKEQANALIVKGEQVVAGVNADFFGMNNGDPVGAVIKDGVIVNEPNIAWNFFGITKDGSAIIGNNATYLSVKGNLEEALGGNAILVKDGAVFETPTTGAEREPRTAVGIKEDGTIFFLSVDGRQEPYSAGISMVELAKLMIAMGAKQALNLDGGGSTTHLSRTPGTDTLEVKNSPSDLSERKVGNSWLIVSKEPVTHTFDTAFVEPQEKSFTKNSVINFTAKGRDLAGASAELPASGLAWSVSDDSFGVIDPSTGVFISNGKEGQFKAILKYNDKVVGESNVEIVVPNEISFYKNELNITQNSSQSLGLQVLYNERPVSYKDGDIIFDIPNGMGTVDKNGVLTTTNTATSGEIKATINGTSLSETIKVNIGELPKVIQDFEIGLDKWAISTAGRGEVGTLKEAIYPNDKVRFGDKSLRLDYDFTNAQKGTTLGVYAGPGTAVSIPGSPKSIGAWVYATEEAQGYWLRMNLLDGAGKAKTVDLTLQTPGIDWIGWKYVEAQIPNTFVGPFSLHSTQTIRLMSLKSGNPGPMTKGSIYVDNIRAVYGSNVDDLFAPIVESINIADKTYTNNTVNITAKLYDNENDPYKSGINWNRVRILVDGIDYTGVAGHFSYDMDGSVSLSDYKWADGIHKVEVIAQDSFGNEAVKTDYFTVSTGNTSVELVKITDKAALGGSVKLDIRSKLNDDIKKISLKLKLNKGFPVNKVDFSSKVTNTAWNYDNATGILTVVADNNGMLNNEDVVGSIYIDVPNTTLKGASVKYDVLACTVEYNTVKTDNFIGSFSAKSENLEVVSAFNIEVKENMVGKDGVIKVTDLNNNPVENAEVVMEKADATLTTLGTTNKEGLIWSKDITDSVKKVNIFAKKDTLLSFKLSVQTLSALKNIKPSNLAFSSTEDAKTQKVISWMSNPLLCEGAAIAQYALKEDYVTKGESAFVAVNGKYSNQSFNGSSDVNANGIVRISSVKLTNLQAGSEYICRVGDGVNWSDTTTFKTLTNKDSFSFVVLGDTQAANLDSLRGLDSILTTIEQAEKKPDFIAHLGDFVDDAAVFSQWDNVTSVFEGKKSVNSIDTIRVLGNHEYMGDANAATAKALFNNTLNGPQENQGGVYSVEYNNVHVSVISFTADKGLLEKELQWLRDDVKKSNKKFNILLTHQPAYYTNPTGGNELIREMLPPVIDELGIDLVFSGHDHAYGRTKQLKNGVEASDGTIYVVAGTTGTKHYSAVNDGSFQVYNDEDTQIYTTVEVNNNLLKVIAKKVDGTVIDEFSINNEAPSIDIDMKGGLFNANVVVKLASDDNNAKIYYTLDGTEPSKNSLEYKEQLLISQTTSLKAITINERGKKSPVLTETYVIDKVAPKITIGNVENGKEYYSSVKPEITVDDNDATVTITLNDREYKGEAIAAEGSYKLKIVVTDKAGNVATKEVSFKIKKEVIVNGDNNNNNNNLNDNFNNNINNLPQTGANYSNNILLFMAITLISIGLVVVKRRSKSKSIKI